MAYGAVLVPIKSQGERDVGREFKRENRSEIYGW
jgi:hypothetical protein